MAFTTLPQGYVSLVFMITAGRFYWGPGGQSPRRLTVALRASASFLHAEKGCGRAFDVLFRRTAFLCAGRPEYPSFSGLACGPPSFFTRRKKAKTCQGGNPLGAPGSLPAFFSGKPAGRPTPDPAYIKRGRGPWVGLLIFSVPRPTGPRGPRAPLLYGRRFRKKRQCRFS